MTMNRSGTRFLAFLWSENFDFEKTLGLESLVKSQ